MEELWHDLSDTDVPSPDWHGDVLAERDRLIRSGEDTFVDWETAKRELRRGFRFYERQSPGLGSYFLDTLYSDIDSLLLQAGIHSVHLGKYRAKSERFPYAIYYEIHHGEMIAIRAVLDMRRDPGWIERKIERLK